jgi:hypothetical protein
MFEGVCIIAPECTVSEPSILAIPHDCLGVLKGTSHWVLRMLTPLQKHCRFNFLRRISDFMKVPGLSRIVIGD